ncbi:ATP-grasp enzyme-like protein [Alkalibacterium sp. AK22]|uniref:ATP-grasp domain-containing protein n=1 Tax=Alkalibacterium sp. AK22 TaxID=1229520 RepID=UPI00044C8892|nr:ATP-grasp domain-containing protein [Alkalibacterium sp. AK22]EXJ23758.1 ATP-grasp enzyme-like protein [Alkalibacterium sp. AK22]
MKILVTGAGEILGQATIKSIKYAEIEATIIALNASRAGAGLYWADRYYIVPRANEPDYLTEIAQILGKEKPDLVIVGTGHEYAVLAASKEELESQYQTTILVSSKEVIELAADKWLTHQFLEKNGLDHPLSCLPGAEDKLIKQVGFPLIVKPRVGSGSVGVEKVDSIDELKKAIKVIPHPIIQECVGSGEEEYTAGVLVLGGKAVSSITMKRELRHGNTSIARAEPYGEVNQYLEHLAETLGVFGPVNLQYRLVDKKVKLFEINARLSGTTYFRTLSNVNEIALSIDYLVNKKDVTQPEIKPVDIIRYYEEMIIPDS